MLPDLNIKMQLDKEIIDKSAAGFSKDEPNELADAKILLRRAGVKSMQWEAAYIPKKFPEIERPNITQFEVEDLRRNEMLERINQAANLLEREQALAEIIMLALIINPELNDRYDKLPSEHDRKLSGLPIIALIDLFSNRSNEWNIPVGIVYPGKIYANINLGRFLIEEIKLPRSIFINIEGEVVFQDVDIPNSSIRNSTLNGSRLERVNAEGLVVNSSNLMKVEIIDVDLENSNFTKVNFESSNFKRSRLGSSKISYSNLNEIEFSSGNLNLAIIENIDLERAKFLNTAMYSMRVEKSSLDGTTFLDSQLPGVTIRNSRMVGCTVSGCIARDVRFNDVVAQDIKIEKSYLDGSFFENCDLSGSIWKGNHYYRLGEGSRELGSMSLSAPEEKIVVFRNCNCTKVDMSEESFTGMLMKTCDLKNANFAGAKFVDTLFSGCDCTGCDFSGADLSGLGFFGELKLEGAIMPDGTVYEDGCLERFLSRN